MKWTEKQREAIELRQKNMLVSAAAGSGKTAVLVERMKQLIMKDGVAVERLLVVTFTNAAAGEMKGKIIKAITKEIEDNPKEAHFLRKQLNSLYKANISTFHAFALTVIRRYFHVIGVDPSFKVCDEAQARILHGQAMDRLFEDLFESGDQDFIDFLKCYATGKNEDGAKEMISAAYATLMSIPEPFSWLAEYVKAIDMNQEQFYSSRLFAFIKKDIEEGLKRAVFGYRAVFELLSGCGAVLLAEKSARESRAVEALQEVLDSGDFPLLAERINALPSERYVAVKAEKESYEEVKQTVKFLRDRAADSIKKLRVTYFALPISEYLEDMRNTCGKADYLARMVVEFYRLYQELKTEKKLIDFSDIEHMALEILKDEQVAAEYRQKFEYIFIDEYQDSNLIQDTLIARIKRDDNLFMVGDVKQSIYKFRLAEPEIFMEKYERYKTAPGSSKVDLNMNFRSKGGIIDGINHVFAQIMARYDGDAALYKGVSYEGPLDRGIDLHLVDSGREGFEELDDQIKEMKTAELEAYTAVKLIQEAVGQVIYDEKKGIERSLTKKDIVILMRSTKNYADRFYQVMADSNIPAHIDTGDGYFDTLEINLFLNLLRIIDNKKQDIPLLSVLRSAVFHFTIEELIEIRLGKRQGAYYKAFESYGAGGRDEGLREKCQRALSRLAKWKRLSACMPLEELITQLMWETGYYTYMGALAGGGQRQANLRALADKAVKFSAMNMDGIYGFISYVDALKERGVPMGQVSLLGENDDVVRIMTIHKSKGLEYPMVIVAGLGRKFNRRTASGGISIHKDMGIGLRYVNSQEHWFRKTMMQSAIERKMYMESMEEEVRVLYVAFTRAMDRLTLLGSIDNLEKMKERCDCLMPGDILSAGNDLDLILPALLGRVTPVIHNRAGIAAFTGQAKAGAEDIRRLFVRDEQTVGDCFEEIDRRLSFEYPYKDQLSMKSKYSVTELNKAAKGSGKTYPVSLAAPGFMGEKRGFTASEKGTIIHTALEHLDFSAALAGGEEYLRGFIQSLSDRLILLPEECGTINVSKLEAFVTSPIGRRAAQAAEIYKELPFNLLQQINGVEIMVQGIIDCCFVEDGEYVLLDYKTNYISSAEAADVDKIAGQYAQQVALYREALETSKKVRVKESYLYLLSNDSFVEIK